jgi:TetR/AcrR family transcriptional regulator, ethionamide resistance regulator
MTRRHPCCQSAGFVDPALLPAETAAWLTWMAQRGFHQRVRDASDPELDRIIDAYTRIVWNTLLAISESRVR